MIPRQEGIEELVAQAKIFAEAAKAPATRKAYAGDLEDYRDFCARMGQPLFAAGGEVLALYIADLARRGKKVSTISRRLAAIATEYHAAGHRDTPASSFVVKEVLKGARRILGTAQERKDPLLPDDLRRIVAACPENLLGARDRVLVLLGFALGSRRAVLAALTVADLQTTEQGLIVTIRADKEDQEQQGRKAPVAFSAHPETCPIRALAVWMKAASISKGPLLRAVDRHGSVSSQSLEPGSIARILKKAVRRAGMAEAGVSKIGGHSLRAGMATTAAIHGAGEREIALVTGHRSREVKRYIRDANLFRASAAGKLGL